MAITLPTLDEIETLLRRVVREEISKAGPESMSTAEAAIYARRSTKTIHNWIDQGLPASRLGRHRRIQRADLDRFMAGERSAANESVGDRIAAELAGKR